MSTLMCATDGQIFKEELERVDQPGGPILDSQDLKAIFGGIPSIYDVHIKIRDELNEMISRWSDDDSVGNVFLRHVSLASFTACLICPRVMSSDCLINEQADLQPPPVVHIASRLPQESCIFLCIVLWYRMLFIFIWLSSRVCRSCRILLIHFLDHKPRFSFMCCSLYIMGHFNFWLSLSFSDSLSETLSWTLKSGLRPKFNLTSV